MISTPQILKRLEQAREGFDAASKESDQKDTAFYWGRITMLKNLLELSEGNDERFSKTLAELEANAEIAEDPLTIGRIDAYLQVLQAWDDFSKEVSEAMTNYSTE